MLGGCGNVIMNLNNLGVSASPFGVVGKDFAGDKILDLILEQIYLFQMFLDWKIFEQLKKCVLLLENGR